MKALLLVLVLGLAGCASSHADESPESSNETPAVDLSAEGESLTLEQATTLADALHANLSAEGATFDITIPLPDRDVRGNGVVDWTHHQGHMVFDASDSVPQHESFWSEKGVHVPTEDGGSWSVRPTDSRVPFDRAAAIINALATPSRDNPVLVQQSNARWLGQEDVDGETLSVFKKDGLILWIEPEGRVRRVEATMKGLPGRITASFREYAAQEISLP